MNPLVTTKRQQKFLSVYKETKDKEYAAQEAWPELPPNRRKHAANTVLTQPRVNQHLKSAGLGITKLMKRHAAALTAKKTLMCNGTPMEVEDTDAQLRAVELGYKLHRILTVKDEATSQTVNVTIDPGRLAQVAERLEAINKKMIVDTPALPKAAEAEIVDAPKDAKTEIVDDF